MKTLPAKPDALPGLRAAAWVRESTAGQYDNFGPDAQREQISRAIERFNLTATGIEWVVSHSGRTVATTREWQDMLERAGADYDVLVVGYASRFARDARTAFNARHDLHARGAALLFADERLLSSDDESWDYWAKEAVEAESYSRRLSRRVREGLEAKRRRLGTPGGNRPPVGFRREGRPPVLVVDPERMSLVQTAFELSASGMLDREIAGRLGLKLTHLREILTNPVYRGRLHRGEPAATGPTIDPELWDRVQLVRGRFKRRHPGYPVHRQEYALAGILFCAACGRRLTGHGGRYRHVDPCRAFIAARPAGPPTSFPLVRVHGHSYPAATYDGIVPSVLAHIAATASVKASVLGLLEERAQTVDSLAIGRIAKEREAALGRYLNDRDLVALQSTMVRLDGEESEARRPAKTMDRRTTLAYLADLPRLWEETPPERHRPLAEAMFERIEVLGTKEAIVHPTPEAEAHGWRELWGDAVLTSDHRGRYGRGERI
ncbi:MAG: recombinase family protein [Chloroflexi bacterium]|nr:recombinase family protein [Chloroflexota bacterium]